MSVYLDDEPIQLEASDLGGALQAAQQRLEQAGRVIIEVELDGESLVGQEIDQRRETSVEDAELRLKSADRKALIGDVLGQVRARLDEARAAQNEAADLLQQDEQGQAMQRLSSAIEVWQQVQQALLHATQLAGLDLSAMTFEDQPLGDAVTDLLAQLTSLADLIRAQDVVGLADALAYEWPETTDRWQRLLDHVLEQV